MGRVRVELMSRLHVARHRETAWREEEKGREGESRPQEGDER